MAKYFVDVEFQGQTTLEVEADSDADALDIVEAMDRQTFIDASGYGPKPGAVVLADSIDSWVATYSELSHND